MPSTNKSNITLKSYALILKGLGKIKAEIHSTFLSSKKAFYLNTFV